mmetsp:Transcript_23062/g.22209  ORF Transcript_23062/g.22209 Transcript_23062/m.22209 type:complete len:326 (-) Transcript_23062:79-1056(-)
MLTDMQESASAYTAKKVIEVGDKTFYIGPKMQLIMDYLNEKDRYLDESREIILNNTSNDSDDEEDDDDDDDYGVEYAIALSQHECKIEDIVNQLRLVDEERALEKLKNPSKQEIHTNSGLIPIPPPNMPNNNRNITINDKKVSGDSRNLKNTNDNDARHKNHSNVADLWPVISDSNGSFDDSESRNSNQKRGDTKSSHNNDNNDNYRNRNNDNDSSYRSSSSTNNNSSSSTYVRAADSSSNQSNNSSNGDTATISLSIKNTIDMESSLTNIAVHNVSLHCIDSISMNSSNSPISATSRLFAYGGAAGLLRIHTLDIFKEIVTDNL